jgi:hypothetical protein
MLARFTTDWLGVSVAPPRFATPLGYSVCLHTEVSLSLAARLTPWLEFKKPRFHKIANTLALFL